MGEADGAGGRTVLLLEDDPAVVRLVAEALGKAGLAVRIAGGLAEFSAALAGPAPGLFLLDVDLPDGDGFEACRKVRADARFVRVPVVFLTHRGRVDCRLRAFRLGAQDYVTKPFSLEELMARVGAQLSLKARADEQDAELARLTLRERLQSDLMDMVIHDIRTPLATVKMTLDMLSEEGFIGPDQRRQILGVAGEAMDSALLMLGDLLDLRAGKVAVEAAEFPLERPLERARAILAGAAAARGIDIVASASPSAARAVSDERMLLRVLLNLLGNAVKFSPSGKPVEAALALAGGRLRLEVRDRGYGVPDEDKEKIFEKYHRAGEAALTAPGTGIGLSFCRLAAGALGGRVWAEDRAGGGSVFVFEVPAAEAARAQPAEPLLSREALREYLDDSGRRLREADESLSAGAGPRSPAWEAARRLAHQLAGSAGTYGFEEAGRAAARLEAGLLAAAREGAPSPSAGELRGQLAELRGLLSGGPRPAS